MFQNVMRVTRSSEKSWSVESGQPASKISASRTTPLPTRARDVMVEAIDTFYR